VWQSRLSTHGKEGRMRAIQLDGRTRAGAKELAARVKADAARLGLNVFVCCVHRRVTVVGETDEALNAFREAA